jgi:selenide,water dikinase
VNDAPRRLTQFSTGGGCACKMPQSLLGGVLETVRAAGLATLDANLLVGLECPDDAAVYAVDDTRAWIVTCDFMTPVVDSAFDWGRIAATNALSDVYAMGGRPLFALNLLGWPAELPAEAMKDVLRGGAGAVAEAGALTVGGHSIVDPVPKFGLVAIGEVDPRRILRKGGARAGDRLVLTKALGVGVVGTAIKRGQVSPALVEAAVAGMTRLNASAARIASDAGLHGGTDVTGYGLLGHLHEMAAAAGLGARLWMDRVPVLAGVMDLIAAGCAPTGSRRTLDNALGQGWFVPGELDGAAQLLLADAQTSGGLLLAVSAAEADGLVAKLRAGGDAAAALVGEFLGGVQAGVVRADAVSPR